MTSTLIAFLFSAGAVVLVGMGTKYNFLLWHLQTALICHDAFKVFIMNWNLLAINAIMSVRKIKYDLNCQ